MISDSSIGAAQTPNIAVSFAKLSLYICRVHVTNNITLLVRWLVCSTCRALGHSTHAIADRKLRSVFRFLFYLFYFSNVYFVKVLFYCVVTIKKTLKSNLIGKINTFYKCVRKYGRKQYTFSCLHLNIYLRMRLRRNIMYVSLSQCICLISPVAGVYKPVIT